MHVPGGAGTELTAGRRSSRAANDDLRRLAVGRSSISKYSRGSKLKIPATMFVGTVWSALSYVSTVSL